MIEYVDDMNGWGQIQKGPVKIFYENWMPTNLHQPPILFMIPPSYDNKSIKLLQSQ